MMAWGLADNLSCWLVSCTIMLMRKHILLVVACANYLLTLTMLQNLYIVFLIACTI
jgi:hypothetical protein